MEHPENIMGIATEHPENIMGIIENQGRFGPPCSGEGPPVNQADTEKKEEEMKAEEEVLWNG